MKQQTKNSLFGVLFIAVLSIAAWFIAEIPAVKALSFSSLIVGILLGMVYANLPSKAHVPASWGAGMKICSKTLLRTGIVLYGFRLTFQDIVAVGLPAVVIDVIVVTVTIFLGIWLGKLLKMDSETTLLTATGSAICGAAAVLGAEAVVKPESHKTAVAVSTVVIFGTIAMFLYPIAYRAGWMVGLDEQQVGIYTGATLHEVAHVVGAGNAMASDTIAATALIVKMVRVILLVFVLLIMSWALGRSRTVKRSFNEVVGQRSGRSTKWSDNEVVGQQSGQTAQRSKITIPWFAFLFLLMIGVNSLMVAYLPASFMAPFAKTMNIISTFLLTMAMTALGADTSFKKFKQAGAKPFALAALLWLWLIVGGYLMARFLVPLF
ncbi:MAG: YeiH family protein [Paludibacteraceae bacterium]